ncbi:hypothetical protein J7337_006332 [Fusarium musae]|uniref:Uncharacterized protein n=1 Tax=Fusarium musae TaxID=1042133 RepID=A0A9P8DKM5_9HYPO|nr:hypothetical protein J7337_006332 [Fusarium musae]KAG9503487.1 hypothetical protein J7337_006332 [Fusarium musae]
MDIIEISRATHVTKTVHSEPYDAISTDNPKLSQAGKTILITGGGTTIGNEIGRSFVHAAADTVIILGRRLEVLQEGASRLEQEAKAAGTHTKIIHRQLDITDFSAVDAFWEQLTSEGTSVDVFVSNAAAFPQLKPLLESGAKNMWSHLNANMVAKDTLVEEMQITPMHPGLIWSLEWVKLVFKDDVGFDDSQYAQGRFAWASWDVNEQSEGPIRNSIKGGPYYLKMTIRGANP